MQHRSSNIEIGDHTIFQRTHRSDRAGRSSDHLLRFCSDCQHTFGTDVYRYHRRLTHHDPFPFHIDQCVCCAKINADIPCKHLSAPFAPSVSAAAIIDYRPKEGKLLQKNVGWATSAFSSKKAQYHRIFCRVLQNDQLYLLCITAFRSNRNRLRLFRCRKGSLLRQIARR